VGKKSVHLPDFETLIAVNREVVALTNEPHGYSEADGVKLQALVDEMEHRADNQEFDEAVVDKAALLVFKLASGQYFKTGNKRTSLVAGAAYLAKNGYAIDLGNSDLVSTVDRAGIAAADLDEVYDVIRRLSHKSKVDRRAWSKAVSEVVTSYKDALTKMGT
jgi:prophage maintenance system killer protein